MPLLVTAFLRTVVKLLKYELQLFRDRQPQVRCVLRQGHTLIGQIKKITAVLSTLPEPMT